MSDGSTGEIKRLLRVDLDTLQLALDNTSYSISYYLDLETGNVVTIMEESQHEWEALRDTWESGGRTSDIETFLQETETPEWMIEAMCDAAEVEDGYGSRYIEVPRARPDESYRDMEDFAETTQDELLRRRLREALDGKRPYRRFKDTLLSSQQERERWFQFKDERLMQRAFDWLESLGITAIIDDNAIED